MDDGGCGGDGGDCPTLAAAVAAARLPSAGG